MPQVVINVTNQKSGSFVNPAQLTFRYEDSSISAINRPYLSFQIHPSVNGCGLMYLSAIQAYGITSTTTIIANEIKRSLKDWFNSSKIGRGVAISSSIGTFTFAQGDNHISNIAIKMLEEVGFKPLIKYPNYQHGNNGNYKQTLYILSL